jgi:hypothetical protein
VLGVFMLRKLMVMKSYEVIADIEDHTHQETGSGDPVMVLRCTFSKGLCSRAITCLPLRRVGEGRLRRVVRQ